MITDTRLISRGLERPRRLEFDPEVNTSTYGKFVARPLQRGFGHTLGNALRRILLSSIVGSAIAKVKIEGVQHEFSTIEGVRQDVTEIILNLKQIRLKIDGVGDRTLRLSRKTAGDIHAGDLECPPDVTILNPDQIIATLNDDTHSLELEVTARSGRGYVPAEENRDTDDPIGVIAMDAIYSPVLNCNYVIEGSRIGQRTDYDKLVIEIGTDGSINPEDALAFSAKILRDYLSIFINFDEEPVEEEESVNEEEERLKKLLTTSVEELELSVRSSNCLKAANLKTIGELVIRSDQEMLKYRNFGKKSLNEIKEKLSEMGLSLGMKEVSHLVSSTPRSEEG